jgi:hypothetical protein
LLYRDGFRIKDTEFYRLRRGLFTVKQVNLENFIDNLLSGNDKLDGKLM